RIGSVPAGTHRTIIDSLSCEIHFTGAIDGSVISKSHRPHDAIGTVGKCAVVNEMISCRSSGTHPKKTEILEIIRAIGESAFSDHSALVSECRQPVETQSS